MAVATAIHTEPQMKTFRLPKMSPIRPQNRRKHPNVRVYDETIHWTLDAGMFNSRPMVGRIMTTAWIPSVYTNVSIPGGVVRMHGT
jgi:hypothetical protein